LFKNKYTRNNRKTRLTLQIIIYKTNNGELKFVSQKANKRLNQL